MHPIRETIEKQGWILLDGAMGTYYALLQPDHAARGPRAVLEDPGTVRRIYREYLDAGSRILNTHTFTANTFRLGMPRPQLKELLRRALELAREEARPYGAQAAANIGPLPGMTDAGEISPEAASDEYHFILETFLEEGSTLFHFETFTATDWPRKLARTIRQRAPEAFVIASFVLGASGETVHGWSARQILDRLEGDRAVDAVGFNCGTGPSHLLATLREVDLGGRLIAVSPNASYPELIDDRIIYSQNPSYFADTMQQIHARGVQLLGGCCGTTPDHIRLLAGQLTGQGTPSRPASPPKSRPAAEPAPQRPNPFRERVEHRGFVIAVELPPPESSGIGETLSMAGRIRDAGADIVTFSDSPLGRARTNPIALSARVQREVGIQALPHLCCRDRNLIALKSDLLGARLEDLNTILLVTGDPVPQAARQTVAPMFELNSFRLIELVDSMNQTAFRDDPFFIGAALDLNAPNRQVTLERMARKSALGADFFMTQPIFDHAVARFLQESRLDDRVPVIAGIMPIVNYRNARFLDNEIPGIRLPRPVLARFTPEMGRIRSEETGLEIAMETIRAVRAHTRGLYLVTPLGRIGMMEQLIRETRKL